MQKRPRFPKNAQGCPRTPKLAQERSRLFEPYVTNRENGTGLGLSIVKKIIEEHNGSLELLDASPFSNNEDFGAKMRIIFPKEIIIDNEKIANNSIEVEEHGWYINCG